MSEATKSGPGSSPGGHDEGILKRIRQGLLEESTSVSHLLRLALMLGQEAGSDELAQWARKELEGYSNSDDLPSYRLIPVQLTVDGQAGYNIIRGQFVPMSFLPEGTREFFKDGLRMQNGIGDIEEMVSSSENDLQFPLPMNGELSGYITSKLGSGMGVNRVYWMTGRANVAGVLDQVKTRLATLSGQLIRAVPDGQVTPSSAQTSRAVNIALSGDNSQFHLNTSQGGDNSTHTATTTHATAPVDDAPPWWERWRRPGAIFGGVVATVAAVAGLGQWLGWTLPF